MYISSRVGDRGGSRSVSTSSIWLSSGGGSPGVGTFGCSHLSILVVSERVQSEEWKLICLFYEKKGVGLRLPWEGGPVRQGHEDGRVGARRGFHRVRPAPVLVRVLVRVAVGGVGKTGGSW